jgi:hypothetical protein
MSNFDSLDPVRAYAVRGDDYMVTVNAKSIADALRKIEVDVLPALLARVATNKAEQESA